MADLSGYTLEEIENLYRDGRITEENVTEYLRVWNAGPHFTQAVLMDGAIRNFDPESKSAVFYKHLKDKFGLRL